MAPQRNNLDHGGVPPTTGRLLAAGVMAAVMSVVVNDALALLAVAVVGIPGVFPPLHTIAVTVVTVVGVALAVSAFGVATRRSTRPLRFYATVAAVSLLLSWLPDLAIFLHHVFPGTSGTGVAALAVLHLTTASVTGGALTIFTLNKPRAAGAAPPIKAPV